MCFKGLQITKLPGHCVFQPKLIVFLKPTTRHPKQSETASVEANVEFVISLFSQTEKKLQNTNKRGNSEINKTADANRNENKKTTTQNKQETSKQ